MLVTNDPEALLAGWHNTCSMICSECGKSNCQVAGHMPYYCVCGHARMEHAQHHPHICKNCDCEAIDFITPMVARSQMITINAFWASTL
jgi:hypothetical protein